MTGLTGLPPELLHHIISYLNPPKLRSDEASMFLSRSRDLTVAEFLCILEAAEELDLSIFSLTRTCKYMRSVALDIMWQDEVAAWHPEEKGKMVFRTMSYVKNARHWIKTAKASDEQRRRRRTTDVAATYGSTKARSLRELDAFEQGL